MPCRVRDPEDFYEDRINELSAYLCSVLTYVKETQGDLKGFQKFLKQNRIRKQSGVTFNEIKQWYKYHQKEDEKRKRRESNERATGGD